MHGKPISGLWHIGKGSAEDNERAKPFFERAIALDPNFAPAYSGLADAYVNDGAIYATLPLADAAKLSGDWAQRAIAIDLDSAEAQSTMAYSAMVAGNANGAQIHLRLAQAINPNLPVVLGTQGFVLLCSGNPCQARQALTECLRLDPGGFTGLRLQLIVVSH